MGNSAPTIYRRQGGDFCRNCFFPKLQTDTLIFNHRIPLMSKHHTASIELKHGDNSQGFFSFEAPDNLLFFVHGFGGNATGTWNEFPSALTFDDHFSQTDIVFYGYDTFGGQANDHATQLYHFMNKMVQPLANGILPAQQQLPERNYKRILLVAHSLGAILVRQAQLLAEIDNKDWVQKSELALFAPAHHGAAVVSLATQALPGLLSLLGLFARFRFPILNDLDPEKEGIIQSIRSATEKLQDANKGDFTRARLVVHAKGDKVVKNIQYLADKPAAIIEDSSHISVCKPSAKYNEPIHYIKSILFQ